MRVGKTTKGHKTKQRYTFEAQAASKRRTTETTKTKPQNGGVSFPFGLPLPSPGIKGHPILRNPIEISIWVIGPHLAIPLRSFGLNRRSSSPISCNPFAMRPKKKKQKKTALKPNKNEEKQKKKKKKKKKSFWGGHVGEKPRKKGPSPLRKAAQKGPPARLATVGAWHSTHGSRLGHYVAVVVKNRVTPKWVALANGNMH